MTLVRKQTIPTERPPLIGEVSAYFCGIEGVASSAQRIPTAINLDFLDPEPLLFHSSSSSVTLTRLSGHRSRPTTSQTIWQRRESNPEPLDLQPGTPTTRPQRQSKCNKVMFNLYCHVIECDYRWDPD
jgi:hypothetical protein